MRECLAGGASTATVSALLNPMDVIKTRRQILALKQTPLTIARQLYYSGGLPGLWSPGLSATIAREMLYSGCTKGLYPSVRAAVSGEAEPQLWQRALAAVLTGTLGSIFANAVDVVKIRQFDQPDKLPRGVLPAMKQIARSEGWVNGLLLRGVSASAPRGAAIAIGEVTTYDYTKTKLKTLEFFKDEESFVLHAVTAMVTGAVSALYSIEMNASLCVR